MKLFVNPALDDTLKNAFQQRLLTDFGAHSIIPVFRHDLPESEQQTAFRSADLLLGNPPPAWFTQPPPALRFWQLDSAGFDGYQAITLSAQVANMGDYFAWPCAETMVAGLLAFYRRIPELALLQHEREWVGAAVRTRTGLLRHKRVVILGTGTIGQALRQMLTGFDCVVTMLARTDPQAELHTAEELQAVLPQTDIVVNCLPGTATGFFSAGLISAMQPGSIYANVGRGSTTDEPALIAALASGRLGGAVLDVTATEPLPADNPLWALPNVVLTQHTGGGQPAEDAGKVTQFLRNLALFVSDNPLENAVELGRGY
ncbi:D-2-hydroxyacid dehydrogenase [Spirosoma utsteinense]|uniref:Phosphoglycerate dehydrogenase-like enzyme n=1 Tax=Spirosoma utsteinense TaxID=2585773 RepID=A0ABR6WAX8_9BACT|nr:D-2-hydroxyacid dehydrogenase [Spirosoma utsteinense]MBC3785762.1 phosphoglycerate dehydrogenase-like enzyme [Spirosoma utsteinense]MBC3793710.1 phosphoglycerate dehydrogenase-like enzyme [Spirosoma utsteinense]